MGGAHRDHHQMASRLKIYLLKCLRELVPVPTDQLVANRYEKFRRMGVFLERALEGSASESEPAETANAAGPRESGRPLRQTAPRDPNGSA